MEYADAKLSYEIRKRVGEHLLNARKSNKETLKQVESQVKITSKIISLAERGEQNLTVRRLLRLAVHYRLNPCKLFTDCDELEGNQEGKSVDTSESYYSRLAYNAHKEILRTPNLTISGVAIAMENSEDDRFTSASSLHKFFSGTMDVSIGFLIALA